MVSDLKNKTIHGVTWSFVERFSTQAIHFILGIILARLLSPNDYGLIAMLAIFISISQVFIDGGFSSALIQRQHRSDADFTTAFYTNLGISLICYLLLFIFAPLIASFYNQPLLTSITRVYAFNLVLNSLAAIHKVKLSISIDFKTQSKISFIAALISGVISIICALAGYGVWALVIQALLLALFNVVLSYYYVQWFPTFTFSISSFKSLFSFGSKLLIASLISNVYTNLYALVIGKKFSSASLGMYSRAEQFAQFTSSNIASILARVSFPILSQIQDDNERLISVYRRYIQISAFLVFPLILGICGISKPLILLLLTDKWSGCIILLQILCFSYLWNCVVTVNLNLLNVKGRTDLVLKLEIIKKSIAFLILFISLAFDLVGICIGLVLYSFIAFYLNTYYTKKLLNYGFKKQFLELLPYLLLSLLIMCEALFFSYFISSSLISIIFSIIICPLTYICLCFYLRLSAFIEVVSLLKSLPAYKYLNKIYNKFNRYQ